MIIILLLLLCTLEFHIKWPKTAAAMACLMHHKFILIDAVAKEPRKSDCEDIVSSDEEEYESDEDVNRVICEKCVTMASESVSVQKMCVQCRPVRIRSKEDLLKFPSETIPRLPKHGLLLTGSHNWSVQVSRIG